jgi:hypothetical protein
MRRINKKEDFWRKEKAKATLQRVAFLCNVVVKFYPQQKPNAEKFVRNGIVFYPV